MPIQTKLIKGVLIAGLFVSVQSCDSNNTGEERKATLNTAEIDANSTLPLASEPLKEEDKNYTKAILRFKDAHLGDATHLVFVHENGESIDFAGSDNKDYEFMVGLSEEDSNEDNQGWAFNPELLDKKFEIEYYETERELYIDGPVGKVFIIGKAKLLEE